MHEWSFMMESRDHNFSQEWNILGSDITPQTSQTSQSYYIFSLPTQKGRKTYSCVVLGCCTSQQLEATIHSISELYERLCSCLMMSFANNLLVTGFISGDRWLCCALQQRLTSDFVEMGS